MILQKTKTEQHWANFYIMVEKRDQNSSGYLYYLILMHYDYLEIVLSMILILCTEITDKNKL